MLTYRFQSLSSTLDGKVPSLSYCYFPYYQYGNQWEVDTYIKVDEVQKIPTFININNEKTAHLVLIFIPKIEFNALSEF